MMIAAAAGKRGRNFLKRKNFFLRFCFEAFLRPLCSHDANVCVFLWIRDCVCMCGCLYCNLISRFSCSIIIFICFVSSLISFIFFLCVRQAKNRINFPRYITSIIIIGWWWLLLWWWWWRQQIRQRAVGREFCNNSSGSRNYRFTMLLRHLIM